MSTSPKLDQEQEDLNQRLRSLKIDRTDETATVTRVRSPKLLLVVLAAVIVAAAMAYWEGPAELSPGCAR